MLSLMLSLNDSEKEPKKYLWLRALKSIASIITLKGIEEQKLKKKEKAKKLVSRITQTCECMARQNLHFSLKNTLQCPS